jgi:hypothetical protein
MSRYTFSGIFKFLLGILLVQAATVAQVVAALHSDSRDVWILLGGLSLVLSLLAALWFVSILHHARKDAVSRMKDDFSKEREKIRLRAERDKAKVIRQSQEQILKDRDRTQAKASLKVGASFAGALGLGALMLFTQFFTFGLLTLSTAGGALAGYAWRTRQELTRRNREAALQGPRTEKVISWDGARHALASLTRPRHTTAAEAPSTAVRAPGNSP